MKSSSIEIGPLPLKLVRPWHHRPIVRQDHGVATGSFPTFDSFEMSAMEADAMSITPLPPALRRGAWSMALGQGPSCFSYFSDSHGSRWKYSRSGEPTERWEGKVWLR